MVCHEGKAVDLLHIEIAHTDMPGESSWTKIQSYLHTLCLTMHAASFCVHQAVAQQR